MTDEQHFSNTTAYYESLSYKSDFLQYVSQLLNKQHHGCYMFVFGQNNQLAANAKAFDGVDESSGGVSSSFYSLIALSRAKKQIAVVEICRDDFLCFRFQQQEAELANTVLGNWELKLVQLQQFQEELGSVTDKVEQVHIFQFKRLVELVESSVKVLKYLTQTDLDKVWAPAQDVVSLAEQEIAKFVYGVLLPRMDKIDSRLAAIESKIDSINLHLLKQ